MTQSFTASEMREMADILDRMKERAFNAVDARHFRITAQMLRQAADAMERPVKFELTANGGGGWGDKGHTGAVYKGNGGQLIPTPNAGGMQGKG